MPFGRVHAVSSYFAAAEGPGAAPWHRNENAVPIMGMWRTHQDTSLPGSFSVAVSPLLPACPLHGSSLGTSRGSPGRGAGRGSHGPRAGVVAPAQQQHAESLLDIFQQANVLLLVPAARLVPSSLLSDGGTPQPREERGSTVCLKGERACAGRAGRGPAVQAALAGTGGLCSAGKLDPRRAGAALTCGWRLYMAPFGEISDQRYHHPDVHSCADGYGERSEEESSARS